MIRKGTRYPGKIMKGSREVHLLTKGNRPIYMSIQAQKTVQKTWLDANVHTECVAVSDADGYWMELEITLPGDFDGNAVDGWTGEMVAGKPPITLGLFWSQDLTAWTSGGWIDAPGKTTETLDDGRKKWFARYSPNPIWWQDVMIDLHLSSNRYGKSITGIDVLGSAVSLPHYPYAMPSQASTLQTDLRAAGFTGATVTSISESLSVGIKNHVSDGIKALGVAMSGTNVTAVTWQGSTISLPSYPYSMPSQRATLQTHLRSAGYAGAVVMLYDDTWTIDLPNRTAAANYRPVSLNISPGDPYPGYDMYGNYVGEVPANFIQGTSDNVRTPGGDPLQEAGRAFARVGFIL